MEAGLGCPPTDIFLDITPQPVAAASLGQVYKARLKSNGKEVAIKVQRPGVAGKFSQKSAPSILTT
jgi:aarF domain-containing kinase